MKHLLIAIISVLSFLPREQLVSSEVGCPKRYLRRINGKCYYFSVKKMNWFGALNNCLRKGLMLADLSNPRDFYGAIDFLSSKGNTEDFWFGGNDLQTEGRFQYASNGRLVRYYSNYSLVDPAEHSECDDCLEVRIRSNISVVADDNCLERQYFICSELYCEAPEEKKPRHHSHEHLHHFHHDVGVPSEEEEEEMNTPSPFDSQPEQETNEDSEGAAGPPAEETTETEIVDGETVARTKSTAAIDGEAPVTEPGDTAATIEGAPTSETVEGEDAATTETPAEGLRALTDATESDATEAGATEAPDPNAVTEATAVTDAVDAAAKEETTAAEATA